MKALTLAGLILCSLALTTAWVLARDAQLTYTPATPRGEPGWQVVRIVYHSQAELERLTARLDVWEVHPVDHIIVARVNTAENDRLTSEGYTVTAQPIPPRVSLSSAYDCYRTVSQLVADQDALAATYPTLTQIITLGASYEGRPLRVLKLTNTAHPVQDRPRFFLMANIHGREFITPETAMQFARRLLEGYGHDPDLTWLLDGREVHILASANPDGHAHNEGTFTYWRKNANPANQSVCYPTGWGDGYGTDLNRNSDFEWGGSGSSDTVCDPTYRGTLPASDVETQAIQHYVTSLFPDQRGSLITDAAPMTTTGILISLHSYNNQVMWPWGHTYGAAPNAAQLEALGTRFASYNGYTPQPDSALYLASGTTDDWSYGELGIASYTFEMGGSADGFLPTCDRTTALIQPNLDALVYAARVARAPYQLADGPDTTWITLDVLTATVKVQAIITGSQIISSAEAYVDTPPWAGGIPIPLAASDGAFDHSTEIVSDTLSISQAGRHILFVRGQDISGHWGAVAYAAFDGPWAHSFYLPLVMRH